jgi:type II secretory pathway component GspD/PulD (secretin)
MKKIFISSVFIFIFCFSFFISKISAETQLPLLDIEPTISMDFKDADLKDALKIFSIQSGLNFIASEGVRDRKITLYLDKVPLGVAMDKLFKANNLAYELDREANIFVVKDLGKPAVETITKVFFLKFATVSSSSLKEEMSSYIPSGGAGGGGETGSTGTSTSGKWKVEDDTGITTAIKKLLSEVGSVIEDFRTNSLIVTDTPRRMEVISQVIASLDVTVAQVMLEVEMLDVSKGAVDQLGVKWPQSLLKLDMTGASRETNLFGDKGTNPAERTMALAGPTAGGWTLGPWGAAHFGPTIFSVVNAQLTLDFLSTQTDTKYLARPRIVTLNNETAEIRIATNESVGVISTTASAGGTTGTTTAEPERSETGVILRVTPQINTETGEITMFVYPKVSEAVQGNSFIVANNTYQYRDPEERSTKSVVRVKDGETVVIGGLIRNEKTVIETKLPILGDIPLLGAVFRHKNRSKDRERELLVFITPHIIKDNNIQLAQTQTVPLPEREQNTASGLNRELAINSTLKGFEKR